jgi:hypothetical protein
VPQPGKFSKISSISSIHFIDLLLTGTYPLMLHSIHYF